MKQLSTEKEQKVYKVFESIASGYDDANRRISLGLQDGWKQDMLDRIKKLQLPKQPCVLDLCCGTGDIALALREALLDAKIYGLDFSPAMIEEAKRKEQKQERKACFLEDDMLREDSLNAKSKLKEPQMSPKAPAPIKWIQGNAMELPFGAGIFDVVVISFGLRNTPDYPRVVQEIRRVLKPSGKVYCLDSFKPQNPLVLPFYKLYFSKLMPRIGGHGKHNKEYLWLNESTDEFLSPNELCTLFEAEGFARVGITKHMCGACCLIEALVGS